MGRFLGWAMRWMAVGQSPLATIAKFTVVVSVVLGTFVGLLAVGTYVAGTWGGIALMMSPMYPTVWRMIRRPRVPTLDELVSPPPAVPPARSLPRRPN